MIRLDDIQARVDADPNDVVLADLVAFARTVVRHMHAESDPFNISSAAAFDQWLIQHDCEVVARLLKSGSSSAQRDDRLTRKNA